VIETIKVNIDCRYHRARECLDGNCPRNDQPGPLWRGLGM
jgi:hypothetical protein